MLFYLYLLNYHLNYVFQTSSWATGDLPPSLFERARLTSAVDILASFPLAIAGTSVAWLTFSFGEPCFSPLPTTVIPEPLDLRLGSSSSDSPSTIIDFLVSVFFDDVCLTGEACLAGGAGFSSSLVSASFTSSLVFFDFADFLPLALTAAFFVEGERLFFLPLALAAALAGFLEGDLSPLGERLFDREEVFLAAGLVDFRPFRASR